MVLKRSVNFSVYCSISEDRHPCESSPTILIMMCLPFFAFFLPCACRNSARRAKSRRFPRALTFLGLKQVGQVDKLLHNEALQLKLDASGSVLQARIFHRSSASALQKFSSDATFAAASLGDDTPLCCSSRKHLLNVHWHSTLQERCWIGTLVYSAQRALDIHFLV